MSNNQPQHDQWNDCPAGELSQLANRLNARKQRVRRTQLLGKASAFMLLVACGVFVVGFALDPGGPRYGNITCSECKSHFVAYHANETNAEQMEETLATSMATHLQKCERCRTLFGKTYPGVLSAELTQQSSIPMFAVAGFTPCY